MPSPSNINLPTSGTSDPRRRLVSRSFALAPDPGCRSSRSMAHEAESDPRMGVAPPDPQPASLTRTLALSSLCLTLSLSWPVEVMIRGSSRIAMTLTLGRASLG